MMMMKTTVSVKIVLNEKFHQITSENETSFDEKAVSLMNI
jgi:hypothetical protein